VSNNNNNIIITGPHKGASIVLLAGVCRRLSSSVTLPAVGGPTLHGGPVVLRPVMATPCYYYYLFYFILIFIILLFFIIFIIIIIIIIIITNILT